MSVRKSSANPQEVVVIVHGMSITVPNPRRLHKNTVLQKAQERWGHQARLAEVAE